MPLDLPGLTFIFAAGASALLSPCGFPMLPGYISYYMGSKASLGKAVPSGVACTLGLVTVFSIIGAMASILGSLINPYIPLLELVAGLATIVLGVSMLIEIKFPTFSLPLRAPKRRGFIGLFLYGAVYGLATLGCSAPIFFAILFWAIAGGGVLTGIITFMIYAMGMGLPLILTTILLAMAKEMTLKRMVKMLPWLQRISGIILIIIGVYLIYFYYTVF
ncbi:MAG: cytochrome c biogenesis CcdA family protein [Candidatus Bathyarchaeia archaeon]